MLTRRWYSIHSPKKQSRENAKCSLAEYLVKHIAVDIVESLQLLAFSAHELGPVMCWRAI